MADAQLIGQLIAYHRKRLGLSQVELAGLIGRSDSWVSQVERGVRAIDRLSVLQKVADVLGVPVDELRGGESDDSPVAAERPGAFDALRLVLTGHPAIDVALASGDQALTGERLDQFRKQHEQVWPMVHSSRYSDLAPIVTSLIPALERAVRVTDDADLVDSAREILSDTYQAVSAMMGKLGESDAAWIAADRAAFVAEAQHDSLALAASLFRMAHVFLSLSQITQAQVVAQAAAESLKERAATDAAPQVLSLWGAFHLVLAIAAARDNDRVQAHEQLHIAREIAARIGEDRNDFGTEFGPTNVELHAVGVAVELGDAGEALDLARGIDPEALSAERQARYLLDVAQAHAMRRQVGEALRCLEQAERLTPEQTRSHRAAQTVVRDLVQLSGARARPELHQMAERFGVVP
jgi:transcriptional regulator with XRE-family HTH domain